MTTGIQSDCYMPTNYPWLHSLKEASNKESRSWDEHQKPSLSSPIESVGRIDLIKGMLMRVVRL